MKLLMFTIALFPFLVHNVLGKPAELLDLNFDLTPANDTDIEARTKEQPGGKQTALSVTLSDLFATFSTSSLNDAISTNGLSNLVTQ